VVAGAMDAFDVFFEGGVDAGVDLFEEDFAVADDGVQGRAEFVAHIGQELALGLVGLFRQDLFFEGLFGGAVFGDELGLPLP